MLVFFPFLWEVQNKNPTRFVYTMTTKMEIKIFQLCKGMGPGSGRGVEALINGVTKEIKFKQLLEYPLQIMFWKKDSISNFSQVKKVIGNIKDPSRLKPQVPWGAAASMHLAGLYKS